MNDWQRAWGLVVVDPLPDGLREWLDSNHRAWAGPEFLVKPVAQMIDRRGAPDGSSYMNWRHLPLQWTGAATGQSVDLAQWSGGFILRTATGGCEVLWLPAEGVPCTIAYWGDDPRLALWVALIEVFRAAGWLCLHASAAVDANGVAYLTLGRSGAGKSCRLIERMAKGGQPLAEDRVWLGVADLTLVARDEHVRLHANALDLFECVDRRLALRDSDGKWRLPWQALGQKPAMPAAAQRLEVVLAPSQAVFDHRMTVAQAIWESVGLPFTSQARAQVQRGVAQLLSLPMVVIQRS